MNSCFSKAVLQLCGGHEGQARGLEQVQGRNEKAEPKAQEPATWEGIVTRWGGLCEDRGAEEGSGPGVGSLVL